MMVTIRTMEHRDVPFALKLTDTEGWGYTAADFERLMTLEPGGCVVAEDDGRPVGLTCLTAYPGVAWIGSVIVHPDLRGKGVGVAMMRRVLEYAEGTGAETTRLNAYLHVVPFYMELGYRGEFENIRFWGKGRGRVFPGATRATPGDLKALSDFDAPYFGASRSKVLELLLRDYPEGFLLTKDGGDVIGYIVAASTAQAVEIGPWVVDPRHPKVAEGLLLHALALSRGRSVGMTVPVANAAAVTLAHAHSLEESFRTLRMYRGSRSHGGDPKGYFALAGMEKG